MKQVIVLIISLLGCMIFTAGCTVENSRRSIVGDSPSYFSNYESIGGNDSFQVSGTVHQFQNEAKLFCIEPKEEIEVRVQGTMKRVSGEIALVYINELGEEIVLADSGEKKKTKIDMAFEVPEGNGYFAYTGEDAVFKFDLDFQNLDREKLNYIGNTKEETPPEVESLPALGELPDSKETEISEPAKELISIGGASQTLTKVSEPYTVCVLSLEEETEISLSADIVVTKKGGGLTLGNFQLTYQCENGESGIVIDKTGKDHSLTGFEWQGHYAQKVTLPAGDTKMILSKVDGKNYRMEIQIQAEVEE